MEIPAFYCVLIIAISSIIAPITLASESAEPSRGWVTVARDLPYQASQGVYKNMTTIRSWVLKEQGFCSQPDRHIVFDRRGRFLTYIDDGPTRQATQARLNQVREGLADKGKVKDWVPGSPSNTGYPFALSCLQPHVDLSAAVDRYLGRQRSDRLWGAWDDLSFGSPEQPRPLHEALLYVYDTRVRQQRLKLPESLPAYMGGQILIESSGRARAHSSADAKGILQLSPSALNDCQISAANHWHRLAQIDCALRLTQQNARNLEPVFMERFGNLPAEKRNRLFSLLLIQAYHGGVGRVISLLNDKQFSGPAAYFAREHSSFSAGDILFGMVFHNLGQNRFGLASLYYVADVQVARETLCATKELADWPFCK